LLYLRREKRLRILLLSQPSNADVNRDLKNGFNRSCYEVEFGSISSQSFAGFDWVVPFSASDLIELCQWPRTLTKNLIPLPSEEVVSLCEDKLKFSQTLIEKGFGRHIPTIAIGLDPPYILKKRIGIYGKECWMIRSRDEESQMLDRLRDSAYYCQEVIRGPREFATHILFLNNKIAKSLNIMYEFENEFPIKGQDQWFIRVIHRCPYLGLFAEILKSIGFEGLCCVNYKVFRGRPYVLEINPRFGGSLAPYFFSFIRHLHPG